MINKIPSADDVEGILSLERLSVNEQVTKWGQALVSAVAGIFAIIGRGAVVADAVGRCGVLPVALAFAFVADAGS